jgi:hypothetical protein
MITKRRNFMSVFVFTACILLTCISCTKHNTLTEDEIAAGWTLLFDGETLNGWKDFNGEGLTMPWHVVDGCIQAKGEGSDEDGYIVTVKE